MIGYANRINQRQRNKYSTTTAIMLRRQQLLVIIIAVIMEMVMIHQPNSAWLTFVMAASTCDLECPTNIGAKCAFGASPHLLNTTTTTTTTQQQETSINGMHCTCPMYYTGIQCEFSYDSCGDDNQHYCFHGGQCKVDATDAYGNTQHYCDCYNAYDPVTKRPYVGKYCELETVASCDDPINPNSYCFNGGICNDKYPEFGSPCLCSGGHSGPRCEYTFGDNATIVDQGGNIVEQKQSSTPIGGDDTSPCTLSCSNGGVCIRGKRSAADQADEYQYWTNQDVDDVDAADSENMYCNCTDAWDGPTCTIEKVVCGDKHCFHGGTCLTRSDTDANNNNPTTYHHCDCTTADNDDASYAGQFCQYQATEYCTKNPGMNGELFCVNHGTCRDNAYEGCDCLAGYKGFSCEFHISNNSNNTNGGDDVEVVNETEEMNGGRPTLDPVDIADCTLECQNGGTCRHGKKSLGGGLDIFAGNTNYMNEEVSTSPDFQHCVCPNNFAGTNCEHAVDAGTGTKCEEGQHLCMHGSKCVNYGNELLCDCDTVDSPLATFFAGSHCEHPVNDVCTDSIDPNAATTPSKVTFGNSVPGSVTAYCVNGGTCKDVVSGNDPHPGCNCPEGYLGPHCELRESSEVPNTRENDPYVNQQVPNDDFYYENDGLSGIGIFFIVMSLISVGVAAAFVVYEYIRRQQRRNEAITSTLMWSSAPNFRDGGSTEINIAPKRGSAHYSDEDDNDTNTNISPYEDAIVRSSPSPTNHEELWSSTVAMHVASATVDGSSVIHEPHDRQNSFDGSTIVDTDDYNNNDNVHYSIPHIDIGPPIDEDGHELHNVEIV